MRPSISRSVIILFTSFTLLIAQEQPGSGGWRRAEDDPPEPGGQTAPRPADAYGQPIGPAAPVDQTAPPADMAAQLVVPAGTFLNVRINEMLRSDRSQHGDPFSATLTQPLVVDGVVVAQRGQTVYGRIAGVQKQTSSRPSQMALELTDITLVDGRQTPLRAQLARLEGGTMPTGQQVGTVATTTAVGATVGAIADWGRGAAIGAGVGAGAGLIGILMTRHRPTVVYPETAFTFRMTAPLTISTARAPMAFRYVDPSDYERADRPVAKRVYQPRPAYGPVWGPVWGPPYYPYYWGPGISFVYGGGFWGPGFWGRGWHRGGWRRWR